MTPKVPDYGHQYADKKLAALIRRLHLSYRQARISLQEKIGAYMEQFEKEDAEQRALYDSGELSHEDYMSWRYRKIAGTRQWRDMLEQLTTDMVNQDKIAAGMMRDELPEVYAENHNYGTYQIERDLQMSTSYTLYNRDAVARLLKGNPDLLPQPRVDIPKDARWNRQHIQSSVLQGILTGESMKKIADRMQNVVGMDERAAMRNARTAVTGAENAGKLDSMKRAQELGVQLKKLWLATRDGRTRDSHVMMDGEMAEVDEKFSNGCMYPGDPNGAPAEVYNCRCAMRSKVAGADPYSPDLSKNQRLGGMSYEEWKQQAGERYYNRLFGKKSDSSLKRELREEKPVNFFENQKKPDVSAKSNSNTTQINSSTVTRHLVSEIQKSDWYTSLHAVSNKTGELDDALSKMTEEQLRIIKKGAEKMLPGDFNKPGPGRYLPDKKKIEMDFNNPGPKDIAVGHKTALKTLFHELTHGINQLNGSELSKTPGLRQAAENDALKFVNKIFVREGLPEVKTFDVWSMSSDQWRAVNEEIALFGPNVDKYHAVSDIFEALSDGLLGGRNSGGYGHGPNYWLDANAFEDEFVAHSGQSYFIDDEFEKVFTDSGKMLIDRMVQLYGQS